MTIEKIFGGNPMKITNEQLMNEKIRHENEEEVLESCTCRKCGDKTLCRGVHSDKEPHELTLCANCV